MKVLSIPIFRLEAVFFTNYKSHNGNEAESRKFNWSRREELNTPSADYRSAALTLSYTGKTADSLLIFRIL
jgi:hypothetical protein